MKTNSRITRLLAASLMFLAILTAFPARGGEDWVVVKVTGSAWVSQPQLQKARLSSGSALRPGGTISTGSNGRALLIRGAERMLVGPNSMVGLPRVDVGAGRTVILERAGSVLFDVERRKVKHFAVQTPYLAAVVKGTQFTVDVGRGTSSVTVHRGLVEVSDRASGQVVDVPAGQSVSVSGDGGQPGIKAVNPAVNALAAPAAPASPTVVAGAARGLNARGLNAHGLNAVSLSARGGVSSALDRGGSAGSSSSGESASSSAGGNGNGGGSSSAGGGGASASASGGGGNGSSHGDSDFGLGVSVDARSEGVGVSAGGIHVDIGL